MFETISTYRNYEAKSKLTPYQMLERAAMAVKQDDFQRGRLFRYVCAKARSTLAVENEY